MFRRFAKYTTNSASRRFGTDIPSKAAIKASGKHRYLGYIGGICVSTILLFGLAEYDYSQSIHLILIHV